MCLHDVYVSFDMEDYTEWFNKQPIEEQREILKTQQKIREEYLNPTPKVERKVEVSFKHEEPVLTDIKPEYYKINASDVAGLIGLNPYKTREDVFRKIAEDYCLIEPKDDSLKEDIKQHLEQDIQNVVSSTNFKQLDKAVEKFERAVEKTIVEDIVRRETCQEPILSKKVSVNEVTSKVINDICKNISNVTEAVETAMANPDVKELMKSDEIIDVKKSVNAIRGEKLEEESTNILEKTLGASISFRNTKCYTYKKNKWLIAGRIDGILEDTIVETKTRKRQWKSPPEYDIIQLRCYMKILNKNKGILNEVFPDKTIRITEVNWSDSIWNEIENKIDNAIAEFESKYNL